MSVLSVRGGEEEKGQRSWILTLNWSPSGVWPWQRLRGSDLLLKRERGSNGKRVAGRGRSERERVGENGRGISKSKVSDDIIRPAPL